MIGAFLMGINDLLGDPIGAIAEAADDAARAERRRQAALPANRLASEKLHLYDMMRIHEKSRDFYKEMVDKYPHSRKRNQKSLDEAQAKVDEYKERLKLL